MIPMGFHNGALSAAKANFDLLSASFASYSEALSTDDWSKMRSRISELEQQWHACGLHG